MDRGSKKYRIKMKHIFAFLMLLFPFVSFANDIASMSAYDSIAIFDETLPLIEERIAELNPDLTKRMINADKYDKIYEYNNFLVHHIFDKKAQYYIDMLYKHCEQTGCTVKHNTYSDGSEGYTIEQTDSSTKRSECYKNDARICPYPENYDFSWLELSPNHFQGLIDDLNSAHFYTISVDDRSGHFYLMFYENDFSHNMLVEYNNQAIICNSEDRPYVRAYKECVSNDPEPNPYFKTCKDESLKNWAIAEHDKCLEKYRSLFDVKVNGGAVSVFKNW